MFWRRRVWAAVGPLDETLQYALDWDFIVKAQHAGFKFLRLPRFLACFRVHDEQKVAMMHDRGREEMQAVRRRYLGYEPSHRKVIQKMMPYLLRQLAVHWMYRSRILQLSGTGRDSLDFRRSAQIRQAAATKGSAAVMDGRHSSGT